MYLHQTHQQSNFSFFFYKLLFFPIIDYFSIPKFYRDSVWTVLTGTATDQTSSIVIHDVKEIETWILRLLSAPVPIPNSTRVEVNDDELHEYATKRSNRLIDFRSRF